MKRTSSVLTGLAATAALAVLATPSPAQRLLHDLDGEFENETFGAAVCSVGDVDGDGFDDFAVGAPYNDEHGSNRGVVRIFSGRTGGELMELVGDDLYFLLGFALAGPGDVDGDGWPDLFVGAPQTGWPLPTGPGRARLYSGRDGSEIFFFTGAANGDAFGRAVASAGDVDGDGTSDLLVGAPEADRSGQDSGMARVLSGANGSTLFDFDGAAADDGFGFSVAGIGDVDADGFADLLVGAPFADANGISSGTVEVRSGATGGLLYQVDGAAGEGLGFAVAATGDVNGDGTPDWIAGAPQNSTLTVWGGAAFVHSGADGARLFAFYGDTNVEFFGWSVSGGADVDGDGTPDLLVGSLHDDPNGFPSGSARVYSGADGALLYRYDGEDKFDQLGNAVAPAGDVDGDGYPDVLAAASIATRNGQASGNVRVFAGGPPPPLFLSIDRLDEGASATVELERATPFGTAYLGTSLLGLGATPIGPLGVTMSLERARLYATLPVDAQGRATITQTVPLGFRGSTIWFQAAEPGAVSNWVQRQVQ